MPRRVRSRRQLSSPRSGEASPAGGVACPAAKRPHAGKRRQRRCSAQDGRCSGQEGASVQGDSCSRQEAAKRRQRRCPRQEANAAQCGFLELEEHPVLFRVLRKWTAVRIIPSGYGAVCRGRAARRGVKIQYPVACNRGPPRATGGPCHWRTTWPFWGALSRDARFSGCTREVGGTGFRAWLRPEEQGKAIIDLIERLGRGQPQDVGDTYDKILLKRYSVICVSVR